MDIQLIKNIPNKIIHSITESQFTQDKELIKCKKVFSDKGHYFMTSQYTDNKKQVDTQENNQTRVIPKQSINIKTFLELLMYMTNEYILSKEDYKKVFLNNLESSNENLKAISHKYRILKLRIVDVLDDEILICDYEDCMKFFGMLLDSNLNILIGEDNYSQYKNNHKKTITIFRDSNSCYDFKCEKNFVCVKNRKLYLSLRLLKELSLARLQEYATEYDIVHKGLSKVKLQEKLAMLI
jgi:hypothetical protein